MSIIDDLKKRIRQLEAEQARQHYDLKDLQSLQDLAEVTALEQELVEMNRREQVKEKQQKIEDLKLESEKTLIRQADREALRKQTEQNKAKMVADVDLSLENELFQMNQQQAQKAGWRVCLMFNAASPSEWSDESGGGWRGKGQGTVYDNAAQATAKVEALKQRWPDYPITSLK